MKKIFILLIIISSAITSVAQQTKTITIQWEESATLSKNIAAKKTSTEKAATKNTGKSVTEYAKDQLKLQIDKDNNQYTDTWIDSNYAAPTSLNITNISYTSISQKELESINTYNVPSNINANITSSKARDKIYTILTLSPIVKINGRIQKVKSFQIQYNYDSNRQNSFRIPITNSVLATGNWYKFKVNETGVHSIDKNFLNDIGLNTDGVDPRTIKIYGHGGQSLPLLNSLNNDLFDLPETSIQVIGEGDGSFDNGDRILFYATSTLGWVEENDSNINPYSDDSYYYITSGGNNGLRVQPMNEPTSSGPQITTFNDYKFIENDEESPAKVGRSWFGNRFDIENDQTFELTFPNIVPGSTMEMEYRIASASENPTSMAISVNGAALNPVTFNVINEPTLLSVQPATNIAPVQIPASGDIVTINMLYNNGNNPSSKGYLDFIRINALRQLVGTDGQLQFRNNNVATQSGVGEYSIGNASQFSQVWDVTNPQNITSTQNESNAGNFSFKATLGEIREYVAINPSNYLQPVEIGSSNVPNQNLKGTIFNDASGNFKDIDYLIITAPFLIQPALRLADHHRNIRGTSVKVVTTDKIYQEFSSGKQDIGAIRNFVRYVYENASAPDKRVKYINFFGDTSVDYKNRLPGNNNTVPTFHTQQSTSTFTSYMSDDFYGMMEQEEGQMEDTETLDIALGRMVADNVGLANTLVDKIIAYEAKASYGNWRNNILMISDDADTYSEFNSLQLTLDGLADDISAAKPFVNVKKIHIDAFEQQTSAGGNRYPQVNGIVKNDIEVGALIVNYFGHGGEDGLAKEFIFTKETALTLRNENRYPLIVTVTCEFTKFDLPTRTTAGELTYWNKDGGAISLITTTRSIGVGTGSMLNELLADEIFGFGQDIPDLPAEGLRISKNELAGNSNRRVVFYVGDPAMPLAFPKKDIRLTTINDAPISQSGIVLQGLSYAKLGGQVTTASGALDPTYNGVVEVKLFDKRQERQTLGNDGSQFPNNGGLAILNFTTLGEILFNGQATVTNGEFEVDFIVPQDVQIPVGNGKVSFYAQKENILLDNTGFNLDVQVGGLNPNAGTDTTGPIIQLFMNDESFVSGGITNDSPNLIANLQDGNGINTASGIGHDIIAILDGDEENPFKLNDYYQANVDDYTNGTTTYKLRDLEEGLHTLTLKAWDTYNNSSTAEIQFIVTGDGELALDRVLNYPNPFVNYTEFWFNHNKAEEPFLDVQVQIFTVTGKVVKTISGSYPTNGGNLIREIIWDGRDDFGDRIGKGVYVYKITVKSPLTNQQTEKIEKLVIL
ncbi:peptidase C25 [Patiriisocius marinistellae]|uniref:Peptidase C25 n=1 Tax=Patiriisocius marinistellae TaxID=2494560 RepID=A0A5J4FWK8_9FLAO|nr:type IX secretion system sortase PorU [Patiriisocius marinistellae]GEQ85584.1 peptidase C25 [Patiriisocius marinistellae]